MGATPSERSVQLRITGRVQGVGYRAWALQIASRVGLRGWVRNRADGSVEALVIGAEATVDRMVEACRDGPFGARVVDITVNDAADDGSLGFTPQPTL
ncbi:MAG: acylphosphatase [Alphaproteobacteria bacterium 13_1_20CM_3_64_12]|nr:MAG: acylphosphatase [Alphaproteobacteria bacterium 13_1_20CM_3_64_12]